MSLRSRTVTHNTEKFPYVLSHRQDPNETRVSWIPGRGLEDIETGSTPLRLYTIQFLPTCKKK